jgi:hypothetical protein
MQINALPENYIKDDHLSDQDRILSLYSPFFDIVIELAREFNVPLRTPFIASAGYPDIFPNSHLKKCRKQIALRFAFGHPFSAIKLLKCCHIPEMERKVNQMDEPGIQHPGLLIDY